MIFGGNLKTLKVEMLIGFVENEMAFSTSKVPVADYFFETVWMIIDYEKVVIRYTY